MIRQKLIFKVLIVLFGLHSTNVFAYGSPDNNVIEVSIVSLVATPEKYDRKKIRVIGVAGIEFESQILCLSKDDLQYRLMQQCVHMEFDLKALSFKKKELEAYNGKYVLIEGMFAKRDYPPDKLKSNNSNGGLRITIGPKVNAVLEITRYQLWETP